MNNEIDIDLHKTILTIWAGKKWILILMIIVGAVVLASTLTSKEEYESKALIAITNARYIANFDPRYETVENTLSKGHAYLDLANSDEILQRVYEQWQDPLKSKMRLDDFRKIVAVAVLDNDASLISLTVQAKDPDQAARLANVWGDLVVRRANSVFSGLDEQNLIFFQDQLAQSDQKVKASETALVKFEKRNDLSIHQNSLDSLLARQKEELQKQRVIAQSQEDARSLLLSTKNLADDASVISSDLLNWSTLRTRYYAVTLLVDEKSGSNKDVNVQIQLPVVTEEVTARDFRTQITDWILALEEQNKKSQEVMGDLTSKITELQEKTQILTNEQNQLELDYQVAIETYTTLLRKSEEVRISNQSNVGAVKIAAAAQPPANPISQHIVRNLVLGTAGAALLGSVGLLIIHWWREN